MPFLFLSPSTQDFNPYLTEGNEQFWMNALADRMEPYLNASGVNVTRNNPNGSAAQSIAASNAAPQDFHLALHSNAAPPALQGSLRGVDLYYYPTSADGLRMAGILAENLRSVYPDPDRVQPRPSAVLGELRRTRAPSVLAELGYHDNAEDEAWIREGLDAIARALSAGVSEYFGVPFLTPQAPQQAVVQLESGSLNLRELPEANAPVLAQLPNGAAVQLLGSLNGWATTQYEGLIGFADERYLRLS